MSYKDKTLDDWNTNDLLKYMEDRHRELFNLDHGRWKEEWLEEHLELLKEVEITQR